MRLSKKYGGIQFFSTPEPSPSSETWVLNETLNITETVSYSIYFRTNHESKTSFELRYVRFDQELQYDGVLVYTNGNWTDQAYRTIKFLTIPTGDLLTWLQANGTKEGGGEYNE